MIICFVCGGRIGGGAGVATLSSVALFPSKTFWEFAVFLPKQKPEVQHDESHFLFMSICSHHDSSQAQSLVFRQ